MKKSKEKEKIVDIFGEKATMKGTILFIRGYKNIK